MVDRCFRKEEHLLKSSDFKKVYAKGSRYSNKDFVLYVYPTGNRSASNGHGRRLGLSVGRRLGKAVHRNRIKRLVREVYRASKVRLIDNVDIVVIPKKTDVPLSYDRVKSDLEDLFRKSGLDKS